MKTLMLLVIFFVMTLNLISQNQTDLNNKGKFEYEKSDKELNQVYKMIFQTYKTDTVFIKSLKEAQRQWVKFREAQLKMKYPVYPNKKESISPMCHYYYLAELTNARVKELKQWITGVEEGDVCAGSIKLYGQ